MTVTIAVAGKGGTGKTTLTVLFIRHIVQNHWGSVLAIDADPSANLNLALGLPLAETIGDIREDALQQVKTGSFPAGTSKQDYLDYKINESLVEAEGVDLLAMGRPEGPGCYCAANNVLRLSVDRMANSYDYVVIDNEAGMEHLSRRTTRDVDLLLVVSDATVRGISIAGRTKDLLAELQTRVRRHTRRARLRGRGPRPAPAVDGLGGGDVTPEDVEAGLDRESHGVIDDAADAGRQAAGGAG